MRQYISILPCVTACTESFMIAHTRAHQFIGFKRLFLLFHIDRELKWMILKWTYIIYCCPNIACQGFKKDQNQVKTNIPRVTNEGEGETLVSSSEACTRTFYSKVDVACKKIVLTPTPILCACHYCTIASL